MEDQIKQIEQEALAEIAAAANETATIEALRIKYIGRKGVVTQAFKKMSELGPDDKPQAGQLLNALKISITKALEEKSLAVVGSEESGEKIDITLPGISAKTGSIHPITKTIGEICQIFISMGFKVVEGPEIETEHYNFETLNIPLEHPSRDAFDTFYVKSQSGKYLLRSHTSPVQARFMEKNKPPFSIVVPGRVYRPDATDASHSFMFHQVEGLVVGKDIHFSDLKGAITVFAKQMFGRDTKMRFRPSFFPFTEPSAEVDVSCIVCREQKAENIPFGEAPLRSVREQKRCSLCGGKGWLEILGAGMVNPKVFEKVGYDPQEVTGFAFGMGVERIAILKYGISDIRLFFENDIRFLKQF